LRSFDTSISTELSVLTLPASKIGKKVSRVRPDSPDTHSFNYLVLLTRNLQFYITLATPVEAIRKTITSSERQAA
jgi:hypothetical protein